MKKLLLLLALTAALPTAAMAQSTGEEPADGFKENMWNAAWTKLGDGRLACTGGIFDSPFASAYIFNPPLVGTTEVVEPEGSGEVGEGLCVVVECTNGEKAR